MFKGTERVDEIESFRVVLSEVDDFNVNSIGMLVSDFETKSFVLVKIGLISVTKCLLDDINTYMT